MPHRVTRHAVLLAVAALMAVLVVPSPRAEAQDAGMVLHLAPGGAVPTERVCSGVYGTEQRPFGTFNLAVRCLQPGATLVVHGGTYRERARVTLPESARGTPSARVLVTAAEGEQPVVVGGLRFEGTDHWTIRGIEIVGDGQPYRANGDHPFKLVGGTGWVVEDLHVHDAPTTGLVRIEPAKDGTPPTDWTLRDSCIHGAQDSGGGPNQDHNLYVWAGNGGTGGVIERNVISGAPNGANIKLGNDSGTDPSWGNDGVTIRFNTMVDAVFNVLLVGDSDGNVLERNLLSEVRVPADKPWYSSVRGIYLTGDGNRASDNAWWGAGQFRYVGENGRDDDNGRISVADARQVDPAFGSRGCGGFVPGNDLASPYGHLGSGELPDLADVDIPVERLAGDTRIATAVEVSRAARDRADVAVLARSDDYPDALASSALAGLLDAPVLLSGRDTIPAEVRAELARLGVSRVVLLGGEAALSGSVAATLRGAGLAVERVAGSNRFATAAAVADRVAALRDRGATGPLATGDEVLLVEGSNPDPSRGWPDAVSAGQLAAASGAPVLLTVAGSLPADTRAWLAERRPDRVTVVGGAAAVSGAVVAEVDALVGEVTRIAGSSRYETAEAVAAEVVRRTGDHSPRARTFVASGRGFPDALAAGPAAAAAGGALVLYGGSQESYDRLRAFTAPADDDALLVQVVGGQAAVPGSLEELWALDDAG